MFQFLYIIFKFFIGVLEFSEYRSSVSLVKFILRYFILFDITVARIISLISLSESSLFMYRKTTDICMLILYSATLVNSFINSSTFFVETLGYPICIIYQQIVTVLLLPVQFVPFISFSCLFAMARTSGTMLNRNGKRDIIDLYLITGEKLPAFFCWVWCYLQVCHKRERFYHEWVLNFVKCFYLSIGIILCKIIFILLLM